LGDAEKAGLVFRSRHAENAFIDKFYARLIFPIRDVQERVVGFGGRLMAPAENAPKYLNSPETPVFSKSRILYGLHRARKAIQAEDRAVVVEGYLDVVQAHQAGFHNVVATLGTALTEEHVRLLYRYSKNVVLSFDADEAGVRAALKAAALFDGTDENATVRVLALPPGDDPDSLLARGDAPAFRRAIDSAVTVPEFRLRVLRAKTDVSTDAGKIAFLREALPVLAEVRSVLERDLLVRRLAPYHPAYATGGARAEESLRTELDGYLARRTPSGGAEGGRGAAGPPNTTAKRVRRDDAGSGAPVMLRGERVFPRQGNDGRTYANNGRVAGGGVPAGRPAGNSSGANW
jgi:DNA primase